VRDDDGRTTARQRQDLTRMNDDNYDDADYFEYI